MNNSIPICLMTLAVVFLALSQALAAEDIVLGDFEDGTYQGWTSEGDAFGDGPATGSIGPQRPIKGFQGKGLVNTFLNRDESKGTLTSPQFTINRKFLTFLVGGGYWHNQTEVQVLVDGEVFDIGADPGFRCQAASEWRSMRWISKTLVLQR